MQYYDAYEDVLDEDYGDAYDDAYDERDDEAYDDAYDDDYDEGDEEFGENKRRRRRRRRQVDNRRLPVRRHRRHPRHGKPRRPMPSKVAPKDVKNAFNNVGDDINRLKKQAKLIENDKWIHLLNILVSNPTINTRKIDLPAIGTRAAETVTVVTNVETHLLPQIIIALLIAMRGKGGVPRSLPIIVLGLFALTPDLFSNLEQNKGNITLNKDTFQFNAKSLAVALGAGLLIWKELQDGKK